MDERRRLLDLLTGARARGLLGPGPVAAHLDHALAWADALGDPPAELLDLGSGSGVPGLVLAAAWADSRVTLLDVRRRATDWLGAAVAELGWQDRVEVVGGRAEEAGRRADLRERFELVVARGFGAPAETAECAAAFAAVDGRISVSEPPGGDPARWPAAGLADLGLELVAVPTTPGGSFAVLAKTASLGDRFPRPTGRPRHRPLW